MNIKKWMLVSLTLTAILLVGVLFTPASQFLNANVGNYKRIGFSSVEGYWWRGEAKKVTVDYRGHRVHVGNLEWWFDWGTLLSTRWCVAGANSLSQDMINTHFRLCYFLFDNRLQLIDTLLEFDANILAQVSGLEMKGQWQVNISSITLEDNRLVDSYGEAVWNSAQWHNGEYWLAVGSILSTFDTDQQSAIEINTTDIEGPLEIELKTALSTKEGWNIVGFIEPYDTVPRSLSESLALMSSKVVERRYYFDYQWD